VAFSLTNRWCNPSLASGDITFLPRQTPFATLIAFGVDRVRPHTIDFPQNRHRAHFKISTCLHRSTRPLLLHLTLYNIISCLHHHLHQCKPLRIPRFHHWHGSISDIFPVCLSIYPFSLSHPFTPFSTFLWSLFMLNLDDFTWSCWIPEECFLFLFQKKDTL